MAHPVYIVGLREGRWGVLGRACIILPIWLVCVLTPMAALAWYAEWCSRVDAAPAILEHDARDRGVEVFGSEGASLGNASRGRRPWVEFDRIPALVISAFLAAEDEGFYAHHGVDPRSIARAATTNLRRGAVTQGGSTITQQLAKMYVGRERTFDRKLKEAFLARRIEQHYAKEDILEAYLNRIYLGAGAHGIVAAADRYFGATLDELELHEVALIAGLTSAPSRLNPYHEPDGALARRSYVLRRLSEMAIIGEDERERAAAEPLQLEVRPPDAKLTPYVVDEVRRRLRKNEVASAHGLVVEATTSALLQERGVAEVRAGAEEVGRNRQDPVRLVHLAEAEWAAWLEELGAHHQGELEVGDVVPALVLAATDDGAEAELSVAVGAHDFVVDAAGLRWARYQPKAKKGQKRRKHQKHPRPLAEIASVGDVVQVRILDVVDGQVTQSELVPVSAIQGALVSLEADSGAIRAIAGGVGHDISQYNRVTRACRQPGSAFKPVLYAEAMWRGLTTATLVHDYPVRYEDSAGRLIWEPRNSDRDFDGSLMLASALAHSRNLPAVKLAKRLGLRTVATTARRLGFDSPMKLTHSLVLGASCATPLETTSVYGAFARGGLKLSPYLVRSVQNKRGELLWDQGEYFETSGPIEARLHRLARRNKTPHKRVLTTEVAYLTTYMLRQVVQGGTAYAARKLGVPVAGKTGTTNRFDVWFVGFSEDVLTGVWLGDDRNTRDLGEGESGGTSALPVWMRFMEAALDGRPQADPLDPPPPNVHFHRIDPETGKRAHKNGPGRWMPFIDGSEPEELAPAPLQKIGQSADILDREI